MDIETLFYLGLSFAVGVVFLYLGWYTRCVPIILVKRKPEAQFPALAAVFVLAGSFIIAATIYFLIRFLVGM